MDSSGEEVLLESCCFLLDYHQEQIKRKKKRMWMREIFNLNKEQNKEFTIIYCWKCVSMIENRISGYLHNELSSESNEEKCTAFKEWLDPLLFITILLKTAQLLSKHFPSDLSLCILYFLFHKDKDTPAVPQPSIQHLVHLVCSHKCFDNFCLSKNILINKIFHSNIFLYLFTIHDARELSVSL